MSKQDYLFGVHSVGEWLEAQPQRIESLLVVPRHNARVAALVRAARDVGIPVERVEPNTLKKLAKPRNPQGIAAAVRPYAYADLEQVLARDTSSAGPVLLAIDGVTDPGNLGAIIRSASFFGVTAVLLPNDRAASITPVVERSAAGALARIPLCRMNNLVRTLGDLKEKGFQIVGTIPGPHPEPKELDLTPPVVVIVGSEGKGMRPSLRKLSDAKTSLRTHGPQSLNVATFTTVILYEVYRGITRS